MRLPRDLSARGLISALGRVGCEIDRQTGSHVRLTTRTGGEHHISIPAHDPIKIGTLNSILRNVARHRGVGRDELLKQLFD